MSVGHDSTLPPRTNVSRRQECLTEDAASLNLVLCTSCLARHSSISGHTPRDSPTFKRCADKSFLLACLRFKVCKHGVELLFALLHLFLQSLKPCLRPPEQAFPHPLNVRAHGARRVAGRQHSSR